MRKRRGTTEYLKKWLGYPDTANSWELASNIETIWEVEYRNELQNS